MIATTTDPKTGRVLVVHSDKQQPYTVYVNDAEDWNEIHNYIINENNIDDIPNRKIDCTSEMKCSPKRSVYEMSPAEAEVLRKHPKIRFVEKSTLYNEYVLEQRKYDEGFDKFIDANRYKYNVRNMRSGASPVTAPPKLDYTQWGLYRHSYRANKFVDAGQVDIDIPFTLSGKNVDVVIMDTGVRWDHPEFLKPGSTSPVPSPTTCEQHTRVRDILIHGASEYGINWAAEGLAAPGSNPLNYYDVDGALLMEKGYSSYPWTISWHGSHVAGTAAGNQFGWAFEANIWSIACIDRSDLGWADPCDGFDYIKVWHKNKPINPETGRRNPTVVNGSWGFRQFFRSDLDYDATQRGVSYNKSNMNSTTCPSVYYMDNLNTSYKQFTAVHTVKQAEVDEILDDPDCKDIVFCFSAGNSVDKQDIPGGIDYDNEITNATFYYSDRGHHYNRSGTPAIGAEGREDQVIVSGSMDNFRQTTNGQERCSYFSCRGPKIDIWSAGSSILSPYNSGYDDPRDPNFYNEYLQGTSMSCPNLAGVMALYLQSQPDATRAQARKWVLTHGSVEVSDNDATTSTPGFYDPYQSNSATDPLYWGSNYGLRSSKRRVLLNPFCNNGKASMVGIAVTGISFSH